MFRGLYHFNGVYVELSDLFCCQSDDFLVGYENEEEKLLDVNVGIETQYITFNNNNLIAMLIACIFCQYNC